jgi:hypothetical protein
MDGLCYMVTVFSDALYILLGVLIVSTLLGIILGSIGVHYGLRHEQTKSYKNNRTFGLISLIGLILCFLFPYVGPLVAIIGGTLVGINTIQTTKCLKQNNCGTELGCHINGK